MNRLRIPTSADKLQRPPQTRVIDKRQLGADAERLPAELAVDHGIAEAESRLIGGAIAGECSSRNKAFDGIAIAQPLAADLERAWLDFPRAFFGPVDGEHHGHGLIELSAGADGKKTKAMTKPPGAMNVLRVARVDPKLHAVAVVDPRI